MSHDRFIAELEDLISEYTDQEFVGKGNAEVSVDLTVMLSLSDLSDTFEHDRYELEVDGSGGDFRAVIAGTSLDHADLREKAAELLIEEANRRIKKMTPAQVLDEADDVEITGFDVYDVNLHDIEEA
jgi:hypothetical protein